MDQQDLRILFIFEELDSEKPPSQRVLAGKLNISLGLANAFAKSTFPHYAILNNFHYLGQPHNFYAIAQITRLVCIAGICFGPVAMSAYAKRK